MKIIFLDIDGVLNNKKDILDAYNVWKMTGIRPILVNEDKVKILKSLIDFAGAKIVLSSAWRFNFDEKTIFPKTEDGKDLLNVFNKYGISIYSITPRAMSGRREEEIDLWLESHPDVTSFVIIDDEVSDLMKYKDNLVATSKRRENKSIYEDAGIREENIEQAALILKR